MGRRTFVIILLCATMVVGAEIVDTNRTSITTGKPSRAEIKRGMKKIKREIVTRYSIAGRPANQGENAKGLHRVVGTATLVNGLDTITLNTSIVKGKQDVSFMSATTYNGVVTPLALASRFNTYMIIPLTGSSFIVASSDTTDSATVYFEVRGE